ncbi:MAG: amidase family protein, partial [Coleofasciculaceae cyanobacterium]
MNLELLTADATTIATAIRTGQISAQTVISQCLEQITTRNQTLNCFTTITTETALADAAKIDKAIAQGKNPGPLAGVPFAVKNLFDIANLTTLAGSIINAENPPA